MDLVEFREYCRAKKGATEDTPFDESTLAPRVGGKIFALTDMNSPTFSFNLKCDPEWAVELRELYECVRPGYHMNKKLWNTVEPDETIEDNLIREMIDMSYDLIFKSLKKSIREEILAD